MFKWIVVALGLTMTGCGSTMDKWAGLGVIKEDKDTFNDSRVVEVTPTWLTAETDKDYASTKIGARWNSAYPESISLILEHSGQVGGVAYVGFESIHINVDGKIHKFKVGPTNHSDSGYVSNTIYTESSAVAVIPKSLLYEMVTSENVRIRVNHISTYDDAVFSRLESGYGQELAKSRIIEMLKLL